MRRSARLAVLVVFVLVTTWAMPSEAEEAKGHACCKTTRACAKAAMSCCTPQPTLPPVAPAPTAHLTHAAPAALAPVAWIAPPAVPASPTRSAQPGCPTGRTLLRLLSILQI